MDYEDVVTEATLHWVGDIALIRIDNYRVNRADARPDRLLGLASLDRALDEAFAQAGVAAVALTGRPRTFAIGADFTGVPQIASRADAVRVGREGHRVFRRLHDAAVPTFALINGTALGGGLEIALHCHYRTVSSGAATIGLPECSLGLVPGWGGTQLLPRLVGPEAALRVIVDNPLAQNTVLRGHEVFDLGVADAIFEPGDFLARSLEWVTSVVRGETVIVRTPPDTGKAWTAAIARARHDLDARLRGAAPAPYRAVDLVELARTATLEDGFAAEDEALADLVFSDELRRSMYAFDLTERRARQPAGAPQEGARPINSIGIVGAGAGGARLGLLLAEHLQVPVVLTDIDQAHIDAGTERVHDEIARRLTAGRLDADHASRLTALVTGSLSKEALRDVDVVVEAVVDDLKVKQKVLAECEAIVTPGCLLAASTSSSPVTAVASRLAHPERVVGFHLVSAVPRLSIVEVVRTEHSDSGTLATAFAIAKAMQTPAVLVNDAPAFVADRVLVRLIAEAFDAMDDGASFEVADSALDPLGLPTSPFRLLAHLGPAVVLHLIEAMSEAFPDRFRVSANLARLVAAGKPGIYAAGPDGERVDPDVAALFAPPANVQPTCGEVRERLLGAIAEEIRFLLDEGVVAEPQDVDLCLLAGAGWPFWLGGITPYLDAIGVSERITGRRFRPTGSAAAP